jgi:hypothetical protein
MSHPVPTESTPGKSEKIQRGPTFKNSLRSWQARWKAQREQSQFGQSPPQQKTTGSEPV